MIDPTTTVSIHPYFKVKAGRMKEARATLDQFIARTTKEPGNLYYDFTVSGDLIFCREAYIGAQGLLAHLENIGSVLAGFLEFVDLERLEVHGPAAELDLLRPALDPMQPRWFVFECGVRK